MPQKTTAHFQLTIYPTTVYLKLDLCKHSESGACLHQIHEYGSLMRFFSVDKFCIL